MTYTATVTSRGQVTIPSDIFRKSFLRKGEKVILSVDGGQIRMQSALELVNKLAGSVKVPSHLRGKDIDEIIKEARMKHYGGGSKR